MTKKEVAKKLRKHLNNYIRGLPDWVEYKCVGCNEDVVLAEEQDDVMLTPDEKREKYGKTYQLELCVESEPGQPLDDFE